MPHLWVSPTGRSILLPFPRCLRRALVPLLLSLRSAPRKSSRGLCRSPSTAPATCAENVATAKTTVRWRSAGAAATTATWLEDAGDRWDAIIRDQRRSSPSTVWRSGQRLTDACPLVPAGKGARSVPTLVDGAMQRGRRGPPRGDPCRQNQKHSNINVNNEPTDGQVNAMFLMS